MNVVIYVHALRRGVVLSERRDPMFTSRSHSSASGRYLDLKLILFGAGLIMLLLGIRFRFDWLVWGAIVPLGAALVLRFVGQRDSDEDSGAGPSTSD